MFVSLFDTERVFRKHRDDSISKQVNYIRGLKPFASALTYVQVLSIICALLLEGLLPSDSVWQIEFTHAAVYGFILINLIITAAFIYDEPLSIRLVSTNMHYYDCLYLSYV